jgi:hypothetical protein
MEKLQPDEGWGWKSNWKLDVSKEADIYGWSYASAWTKFDVDPRVRAPKVTPTYKRRCRRRRWVRVMFLLPREEIGKFNSGLQLMTKSIQNIKAGKEEFEALDDPDAAWLRIQFHYCPECCFKGDSAEDLQAHFATSHPKDGSAATQNTKAVEERSEEQLLRHAEQVEECRAQINQWVMVGESGLKSLQKYEYLRAELDWRLYESIQSEFEGVKEGLKKMEEESARRAKERRPRTISNLFMRDRTKSDVARQNSSRWGVVAVGSQCGISTVGEKASFVVINPHPFTHSLALSLALSRTFSLSFSLSLALSLSLSTLATRSLAAKVLLEASRVPLEASRCAGQQR